MTFVLRLSDDPTGSDLELGPTLELFSAFAEMARVDAGDGYEDLYGVPGTDEEVISSDYRELIAEQARRFLVAHGSRISPHTVWLLTEIAGLGIPSDPGRPHSCSRCGGTEISLEERDGTPGAPPTAFGSWLICAACGMEWADSNANGVDDWEDSGS